MTFKVHRSQIKMIRPGDPNFRITDGLITSNRAGFEISKSCPAEYRSIMQQAMAAGWIKPVAYVTERELLFIGLKG